MSGDAPKQRIAALKNLPALVMIVNAQRPSDSIYGKEWVWSTLGKWFDDIAVAKKLANNPIAIAFCCNSLYALKFAYHVMATLGQEEGDALLTKAHNIIFAAPSPLNTDKDAESIDYLFRKDEYSCKILQFLLKNTELRKLYRSSWKMLTDLHHAINYYAQCQKLPEHYISWEPKATDQQIADCLNALGEDPEFLEPIIDIAIDRLGVCFEIYFPQNCTLKDIRELIAYHPGDDPYRIVEQAIHYINGDTETLRCHIANIRRASENGIPLYIDVPSADNQSAVPRFLQTKTPSQVSQAIDGIVRKCEIVANGGVPYAYAMAYVSSVELAPVAPTECYAFHTMSGMRQVLRILFGVFENYGAKNDLFDHLQAMQKFKDLWLLWHKQQPSGRLYLLGITLPYAFMRKPTE